MTAQKFRSSWVELVCRNNMCGAQYRTRVRAGTTSCPRCKRGRYVRRDQAPEWTTATGRPDAPPLGRRLTCKHCDHVITTRAKDGSPVRCPACRQRTWLPASGLTPPPAAPLAPARRPPRDPQPADDQPFTPVAPAPRPRAGRSVVQALTAAAPRRSTRPARPPSNPSRPAVRPPARTTPPPPAAPAPRPARGGGPSLAGFPVRPARPGRCQITTTGCTGAAVFRWGAPIPSPADVHTCDTCSQAIAAAGPPIGLSRFFA